MIFLQGPGQELPAQEVPVINVTSRSRDWSRELSPFFLGPVELYEGHVALNVENAWQYSKVYLGYGDDKGPNKDYWVWAKRGWSKKWADRHPMGRQIPLYSWWRGEKLGYVEARKKIYAPLYSRAVQGTAAYTQLQQLYHEKGQLILWDFDAYNHRELGRSYREVIEDPGRRCGHGFVLAMMLDGERAWEEQGVK